MPNSGRPPHPETSERAIEATLRILRSEGFTAVTMERVAQEIKVGKPALYRRWKDRSDMVFAALMSVTELGTCPDTGHLESDLLSHFLQSIENEVHLTTNASSGSVYAAVMAPEITPRYMESVTRPRRQFGRTIVQRAVARGELAPEVNVDLFLDMLAGAVFYHTYLQRQEMSEADLRQIIYAICQNPPKLLPTLPRDGVNPEA